LQRAKAAKAREIISATMRRFPQGSPIRHALGALLASLKAGRRVGLDVLHKGARWAA
jgi:hypothetical protein